MQFTINSKTLVSVLNAVGRVVPAKSALQILADFLVEVGDGEVKITASDTENRATAAVQAVTDGGGAFCIEAKFLTSIIRSLPDCPVTITVSENGDVSITTEKNRFNAVAQDAKQYPDNDFKDDAVASFQIASEALLTGLAETSFAVGNDDFHPQMMGVYFDVKADKAVFVGTDTRRLVKSVQQVESGVEAACILSTKAINAVTGLAAKEPNVSVAIYPTSVEFKSESFSLRCQLIKGNYPPYDRVIPQNNNIVATFNRTDLLNAIRRISNCADSSFGMLRFDFDDSQVVISSCDAAFNRSAKETAECDSNGARLTIGLSADMLQSLLSAQSAEHVELRMSGPDKPVVILPAGDDQHLTMLLMPMNVQR